MKSTISNPQSAMGFQGGQGRSADEVEEDGKAAAGAAIVGAILVIGVVLGVAIHAWLVPWLF